MGLNNKGATQTVFVIIGSLATLAILGILLYFFFGGKISAHSSDKQQSQQIAEEGLTQALQKIKDDPAWSEGFLNVKFSEGIYSVVIEKVSDSISKARSTGVKNSGKTVIICTYKLEKIDSVIKPKTLNWEYQ